MVKIKVALIILVVVQIGQSVFASDLAREKRMADEIIEVILDGEVEMLSAADNDFLSIYTEAPSSNKASIIIHGRGFHPDWIDTVQPLRIGLVDYGWNTLSIQMPVLAKEAKYYDYLKVFDEAIPRIKAAIDFLIARGNEHIVIVAHSCGVHMSMHYLREKGEDNLSAYVGIGMGATDYKQPMSQPFPLDIISMPVLDIYGAEDFPAVHRLAPGRWQQIQQAGNEDSKQLVIAEANHYFTDRGDELLEAVGQWLDGLSLE